MYYDFKKLKEISIITVIKDWGIKTKPRGNNSLYVLCPNPEHSDKDLGSCVATSSASVNAFNCFACGVKGSVIDFVAILERCNVPKAAQILAEQYGISEVASGSLKRKPKPILDAGECAVLGLKDCVFIKIPGEEKNETQVYTLMEFAEESKEDYNALLLCKAIDKLSAIKSFLKSEDAKYCPREITEEVLSSVILDVLEKGLIKT